MAPQAAVALLGGRATARAEMLVVGEKVEAAEAREEAAKAEAAAATAARRAAKTTEAVRGVEARAAAVVREAVTTEGRAAKVGLKMKEMVGHWLAVQKEASTAARRGG